MRCLKKKNADDRSRVNDQWEKSSRALPSSREKREEDREKPATVAAQLQLKKQGEGRPEEKARMQGAAWRCGRWELNDLKRERWGGGGGGVGGGGSDVACKGSLRKDVASNKRRATGGKENRLGVCPLYKVTGDQGV